MLDSSFISILDDKEKRIFLNKYWWDNNGFVVEFLDDKPIQAENMVKVLFPEDVLSIRITHMYQSWKLDANLYKIIKQMGAEITSFNFNALLKIKNSQFIKWYNRQECIDNTNRKKNIVHYLIFCDDTLIEIVNDRDPIIKKSKAKVPPTI